MKLAVISLGGRSSQKVVEEATKYFSEVDDLKIKDIEVNVTSKDMNVFYSGDKLKKYDCIYLRGSHKYALLQRAITEALRGESYIPFSPESFNFGHDKILTALALKKAKIPLPTTYIATSIPVARNILNRIHYPIIIKIPSGTQGKGVMFAESQASAKTVLDTLDVLKQPCIIQEYIETKSTDIRAIVVGNKVIASMKRKGAKGDLRSNIHQGGIGENYECDEELEEIAVRSAKAINAEICGIDILRTGNKIFVLEVNLSPAFEGGISEATKKNIAEPVVKYLYEKTKKFIEDKKQVDTNNIITSLDTKELNKLYTSLTIKEGIIKLPSIVTKVTGFNQDEDVIISARKGFLKIEKHNIEN